MRVARVALLVVGGVVACAQGQTGGSDDDDDTGTPDAPVGGDIDAPRAADAAPVIDAPVVPQPDAMVMIDASTAGCPPPPTGATGCPSCGEFCDAPWPAAWNASAGATHYIVQYQCSITTFTYQSSDTSVDLCSEVGMCTNDSCAFGAGAVQVKACNATCCSSLVTVPDSPIACGGGVCC